jgi:hypothetical protein
MLSHKLSLRTSAAGPLPKAQQHVSVSHGPVHCKLGARVASQSLLSPQRHADVVDVRVEVQPCGSFGWFGRGGIHKAALAQVFGPVNEDGSGTGQVPMILARMWQDMHQGMALSGRYHWR